VTSHETCSRRVATGDDSASAGKFGGFADQAVERDKLEPLTAAPTLLAAVVCRAPRRIRL